MTTCNEVLLYDDDVDDDDDDDDDDDADYNEATFRDGFYNITNRGRELK